MIKKLRAPLPAGSLLSDGTEPDIVPNVSMRTVTAVTVSEPLVMRKGASLTLVFLARDFVRVVSGQGSACSVTRIPNVRMVIPCMVRIRLAIAIVATHAFGALDVNMKQSV